MPNGNTIYICERCRQPIQGKICKLEYEGMVYSKICEKCLSQLKEEHPEFFRR